MEIIFNLSKEVEVEYKSILVRAFIVLHREKFKYITITKAIEDLDFFSSRKTIIILWTPRIEYQEYVKSIGYNTHTIGNLKKKFDKIWSAI